MAHQDLAHALGVFEHAPAFDLDDVQRGDPPQAPARAGYAAGLDPRDVVPVQEANAAHLRLAAEPRAHRVRVHEPVAR